MTPKPDVEPVSCRECGKVYKPDGQTDRTQGYSRAVDGSVLCRDRPSCRGRQLSAEYEKLGLKRWTRHTLEQLLAIMDVPPATWDRKGKKKWESLYEPHERVGAAIEFYSTCYPVCIRYAVQIDADGEPIREYGEWKRHTTRSLAAVLCLSQSVVARAIRYRKARNLLTVLDDRLYPELAPIPLTQAERDVCVHDSDSNGIKELAGLLPSVQKILLKLRVLLPPESYTRLESVAAEARTQQNHDISEARARAAKAVLEACQPFVSLLSRNGEFLEPRIHQPPSSSEPPVDAQLQESDDDASPDKFLPTEPKTPDELAAIYDTGAGKGAMGKLPRPRPPVPATIAAQQIAQATGLDEDAAGKIWRETVNADRSVKIAEVVQLVLMKIHQLRDAIRKGKIENLPGLLIKSVPKMVKGPDLELARQIVRQTAEQKRDEDKERRMLAEQILSNAFPDCSDTEREWARAVLGEQANGGADDQAKAASGND